jgi:hypothetical protein
MLMGLAIAGIAIAERHVGLALALATTVAIDAGALFGLLHARGDSAVWDV